MEDPTTKETEPLLDLNHLSSQDLDTLLMLADFFTRFHAEFATDDGKRGNSNGTFHRKRQLGRVVITPQDVLSAIQYRRDVQRYHMFSSEVEDIIKHSNDFTSFPNIQERNRQLEEAKEELANDIWKRKQNRIGKGRMSKDEDIAKLLSTFEVWATKAIAEEALLHKPINGSASCSAVLSIPSGEYLAAILPKCKYNAMKMLQSSFTMLDPNIKGKDYKGKLGVTPNSLTYKEFLRLSVMISSLNDNGAHSALATSPMTKSVINPLRAYDPNHPSSIYSRKENSHQDHSKVGIRGVDLVALWIRAQRNTSALLLLMSLFDFQEDNFEDIKRKVNLDRANQNEEQKSNKISSADDPYLSMKIWNYKATYKGNFVKMQSLSNKFAAMVEDLVNFSVSNQLLFAQEYMRKKDESAEKGAAVAKTIQISPQLESSAKQFILRWLARRHRRALQAVFAGDISYDHEYMSYLKSFELNYEHIKEETKRILWHNFKTVDRTLSRLDRKIPNPAMECCTTISSFKASVSNILSALEQAVSVNEHFTERVKAARIDFELLCNKFLSTTGPCLSNLLRDQSGSDTADVLESLPEPWDAGVKCGTCKQKVSGNSVVQCWNCGEQVHEDCIHNQQYSMHVENLEEDRQLFSVYLHARNIPSLPDYVVNPIEWSEHDVSLKRSIESNGQYSSWGLSIMYTEACEKRYDECVRSILDPTRWNDAYRDFGGNSPLLRVPHSGFLITRCQPDSMLKIGDIVTEISLGGNQLLPSFIGNKVLVNLRHEEIEKLVKAPASEMTLKVFRPSKDITKLSDDFIRDFKSIRDEVCSLHRSILKSRWYCSACDEIGSFSTTTQEEALNCQAIVRRLGMEESSLLFHDENTPQYSYDLNRNMDHTDDAISISSCDSKNDRTDRHDDLTHFSLRRLDAMMDILSNPLHLSNETTLAPFNPPPWMTKTNIFYTDRSLWSQPSRILCAGMVSIFERAKEEEIEEIDRKDLLVQFIKLYFAWCKDVKARRSRGPPKVATMAITPWLVDSCSYCRVCPVDVKCGELCTSCFQLCNAQKFTGNKSNGLIHSNSVQAFHSYSVCAYDKYAGFVGSLLFIHQNDSLIQRVVTRTGLVMEEGLTLCKLLVISYIPSEYLTPEKVKNLVLEKNDDEADDWKNASGIFYLLPLFGVYQSNYLPQYYTYLENGQGPVDLTLTKLDGIIGMTYLQLKNRLNQTRKMVESVDSFIYSRGKIAGSNEIDSSQSLSKNQMDSDTCDDIVSMREADFDSPSPRSITPHGDLVQNLLSDVRRSRSVMELYCSSQEFSNVLSNLNAISISRHIVGTGDDDTFCSTRGNAWKNHFNASSTSSKRRKLHDTSVNTSIDTNVSSSYLKDLFVFDAVNVVQERKCQLYYTDFVFWDRNKYNPVWNKRRMERMKEMNRIMAAQLLQSPLNVNDRMRLIVLQRRKRNSARQNDDTDEEYSPEVDEEQDDSDKEKYPGLGWGFELILWPDKILRVGRVAKSSPAHCAGLKPNDKILSVDGIPSSMIRTKADLANHLLGCHPKQKTLVEENIAPMPYLYQEQCGGKIKDIVVLQVQNDEKSGAATSLSSEGKVSAVNRLNQPCQPLQHRLLVAKKAKEPLGSSRQNQKSEIRQQETIQSTHSSQQQNHILPHPVENILTMKHLYTPSFNACFFTLAECAVLIEAMRRNCPKLAIRLLTPRYDPFRVDEEYKTRLKPYIERYGVSCFPKLSEIQWQKLLGWDLERIRTETGPVVFKENNFEYRNATKVLPIDRLFDSFFRNMFRNGQQLLSGPSNQLQYRQLHEQRIDHSNNSQENNAISQSAPQEEDQILRIRGGGDEQNGYKDLSLTKLQVQSITADAQKFVFGWWLKNDDTSSSTQIFVGRLESQSSSPDHVVVRIMHSFPTGTLSEEFSVECRKECTFLLPGTDRSSTVQDAVTATKNALKKYRNEFTKLANLFTIETSQPNISLDKSCVSSAKNISHSSCTNAGSNDLDRDNALKLMAAALKIEEDLAISATSLLGMLPNGDMIHWFGSDPTVLYIQSMCSEKYNAISKALSICEFDCDKDGVLANEQEITDALGKSDYGCYFSSNSSIEAEKKGKRTFSCSSIEHSEQKFGANMKEPFEWIRIDDGSSILNVCADLATYLCTQCNQLKEYAIKFEPSKDFSDSATDFGKRVIFDIRTFVKLSDRGIPSFLNLKNIKISIRTRELIMLWVKIACLFCVESSGSYRLEKSLRPSIQQLFIEDEQECDDQDIISQIDVENGIDDSLDDPKENIPSSLGLPCDCCDKKAINMLNCHICRRPGEVVVSSDTDKHGVGCSLLSDICLEFDDTAERQMILAAKLESPKTTTEVLKNILLNIAANIPNSLRRQPVNSGASDTSIWGSHLSGWINSVQMASSLYVLSQALIVLKISLEVSRMPRWWKTPNCGWLNNAILASSCTESSFALHLYVLDAAITEAATTATNDTKEKKKMDITHNNSGDEEILQSVKSDLRRLSHRSIKDRFAILQDWASELQMHVFEGDSHDDCLNCGDGGDLICCEYCPNVAHVGCLGLKHTFFNNEAWVCNACKEYIVVTRSQFKDGFSKLQKWASEAKIDTFEGESLDDCVLCQDGGDLLCCEYCPNVVHPECLGLKRTFSNDEGWVCNRCRNRIIIARSNILK